MNQEETAPLEPEKLEILEECASIAYSDKAKVFAKILLEICWNKRNHVKDLAFKISIIRSNSGENK